jgi:hypothetical protein
LIPILGALRYNRAMNDSGPIEVLVLFGVVFAWLAWTVALGVVKRFHRFRVSTLLALMTLTSVLLALYIYAIKR